MQQHQAESTSRTIPSTTTKQSCCKRIIGSLHQCWGQKCLNNLVPILRIEVLRTVSIGDEVWLAGSTELIGSSVPFTVVDLDGAVEEVKS